MPRYKDEPPAVRVYTVCDESKYLIVRNVPALGCGDELKQLFATYGEVEDCKPMDAEECEAFTDVYWIKFHMISNARFAKRKLDESVFLGNRLQVSYATEYETLSDTKEKLEGRRKEVLGRLKSGRSRGNEMQSIGVSNPPLLHGSPSQVSQQLDVKQGCYPKEMDQLSKVDPSLITRVSSDQDYFPSQSMNETVRRVREKLDKIESTSSNMQSGQASKKMRVDNRRRI
ncbi:RNA-binding protein 48-like isoform X2 [Chenopodium quinoa]|uniref:RNA-binding protein 48-like isoform X2 n=1 Tax=Chenopodium quinoa TaxID=63459 RepID=UPI000B779BE4|nr:RNA-binding protein 48-like isoform X2 [Chenopodium quinoa]XP_021742869.1 RNA-binding protein 48-like isoform X2 [Chenopodium quinoa]XP_021742874.1 RNA-binding protein 48-like isoform X2 [Chenopodium quinoa]XP_021742881.1 RNA-binding protein 48-like isoform X2 [Chenopodium quinoa]